MVRFGDRAGRLAGDDAADAGEHGLVRLPVAAGGERVAVRPVLRVAVRVPAAAPHPVDQGRADPVALDGERVVGVRHVGVGDAGEHGFDVGGAAGRLGKAREDATPHGFPRQAQALNHRRRAHADGPGRRRRRERIGFAHVVARRPHRGADLVGDAVPAGVAEGGGQASGHRAATSREQAGQKIGRVAHAGERHPRVDRTPAEEPRRARGERGRQTERAQAVDVHDVAGGGQRGADFEQRRAVEQRGDPVASAGRPDEELRRNRPVAAVEDERLLRRQAPHRPEADPQVSGAERPERRVPGGGGAGSARTGRAGEVPALHDRRQEPVGRGRRRWMWRT